MSYILDALKKADAEREQGTVPGLHSQPRAPVPDDSDPPTRATVPVVWIGTGVAITVIALLSWQLWSREGAAPLAPPSVQQMGGAQEAPVTQVEGPPPVAQPLPRVEAPPAYAPPPPPRVATVPPQMTQARPTNPPEAAKATVPVDATRAAVNSPPATSNGGVPTLSELPEDVRREVPVLTVGGAMYADTPASRMVVLNGQVFHEGDQPVPGLVLEEIKLKSAIFKYKGHRYSIHY